MNILKLDTSSNKEISIGLRINDKEFVKKKGVSFNSAQVVLPLITSLLSEKKLKLQDIDSIEVNIGPGSFTGIRVGTAIANTLSFALSIPVEWKESSDFTLGIAK